MKRLLSIIATFVLIGGVSSFVMNEAFQNYPKEQIKETPIWVSIILSAFVAGISTYMFHNKRRRA